MAWVGRPSMGIRFPRMWAWLVLAQAHQATGSRSFSVDAGGLAVPTSSERGQIRVVREDEAATTAQIRQGRVPARTIRQLKPTLKAPLKQKTL